jgi:hypothetical protein
VIIRNQKQLDSLRNASGTIVYEGPLHLAFRDARADDISCAEIKAHDLDCDNLWVDGLCRISKLNATNVRADSIEALDVWARDIRAPYIRTKILWAERLYSNHVEAPEIHVTHRAMLPT